MAAATYNLQVEQGANFEEFVNLKDSSGAAIDLTGFTAKMQIRPYVSSDFVLLEGTSSNGVLQITPLLGRIEINFTPEQTKQLLYTKSVYDLFITSPSGFVTKVLYGTIEVIQSVTRS